MEGQARAAGRSASWLFICAGALTVVTARMPASGAQNPAVLDVVGMLSVIIGLTSRLLPWERWTPKATLVLVPAALALIAAGNRYGNDAPYEYGVYFVVIFTWVGLSHPRHTSFYLGPLAAIFFVLPLRGAAHVYPGAGGAVAVTTAVCMLVGETVAWAVAGLQDAQRESEHRARLLRAVARATTSITTLEWDNVLVGVVDSVTSLEFEIAAIAMFDGANNTFTFVHPRGLPEAYAARAHPSDEGFAGELRRQRRTFAADHHQHRGDAGVLLDEAGLGAAVVSPIWVRGHLAAALLAASRRNIALSEEDVEALELLAVHAGRALENAQRFGEERDAKQVLAEVSLRDELTGVGNRRHAMHLLEALHPRDALVMIDLDNFKEVNDTHGHGTGDEVLVRLVDHLRKQVRHPEHIARYGGEEFLLVLPGVGDNAGAVARRLVESWRELGPMATFSAGVAVHTAGAAPTVTLAKADAALYAAKRMGRDRSCEHGLDDLALDSSPG